jgi:CDP-glucose 4,6-dehydratase
MDKLVKEKTLKFYSGKKVFITGHTGFKGSWLSYILDSCGAIVKGYSLLPTTKPNLFDNLQFSNSYISVIDDIRNKEKLEKEILDFNPDFIFHLAAQPIVLKSVENPNETFDTNFNGTLNLLEIIRTNNLSVPIILITSDKVYKNLEQGKPFKETDSLGGKDPYSASKAACELLIGSYIDTFFSESTFKIASVRAGNVIGGGDWGDYRLLPDIFRSKAKKGPVILRNPNSTRPWQHVLESVFAYLLLGEKLDLKPKLYKGSWNFGPTENGISVKQVMDIISEIDNSIEYDIIENKENHESKYLSLDISKAISKLHWKPTWTTREAIKRTALWYLSFYENQNPSQLILQDLNLFINYD